MTDNNNYTVDELTHAQLEAVLHLAACVADLQRNPEDADEIYDLIADLAERFNINTAQLDPDPQNTTVTPIRPLTLIVNNVSQTTEET